MSQPLPQAPRIVTAYAASVTAAVLALVGWGWVRDASWRTLGAAGHVPWARVPEWLWFAAAAWIYAALVCWLPYAVAMAIAERWSIRHPAYFIGGAIAAAHAGNAGLLYLRSPLNDDPTGHVPTLLEWTVSAAPVCLFVGACAGLVAWRVLFPRHETPADGL